MKLCRYLVLATLLAPLATENAFGVFARGWTLGYGCNGATLKIGDTDYRVRYPWRTDNGYCPVYYNLVVRWL